MKYQPRYLSYCKANGRTPEAQLEHDRTEWPGGCMCGFILWIQDNRARFAKAHPLAMMGDTISDQKAFTQYLQTQPNPTQP